MKNQISERIFEVLIPNLNGDGIAERISIKVPMEWDGEIQEFLLTPTAHELIDETKARYIGLMLPNEIKEVRQQHGLSQRQMSELIQAGEKSWTRWESGHARPSRVINTLLRAIAEGKVTVEWLQSLRNRNFSWSKAMASNLSHGSSQLTPRVVSFVIKREISPQLPQMEPNYETVATAA